MVGLFYFLVSLQILAGIYAFWEGVRWLAMARKRLGTHRGFYTPRVALICPCKGVEPGLEQNLAALVEFDYPNYEVFFTVASTADPANAVLRKIAAKSKPKVHIVKAGRPQGCGEKVNNLRAAIEEAGPDFEVLVFADSDGRPGPHWLQYLVAPLADSELGAATTFRWYFPEKGGFWSALAAAWNAPIATLLGEHARNFCWGGGTAIRRSVFDQVGALEFWGGSISDDYSLTRALQQAGRRIHFVPESLVPTLQDVDFQGLLAFTNRQIIITRVYSKQLWALAGLAHLLYCGTLLFGLGLLLAGLLFGAPVLHVLLVTLTVPLFAAAKGYLRLMAVSELLPAWKQELVSYGWVWTLLAALVPFVYLWNTLVAAFTRRIVWRGIRYELISANQTRILSF